MDAPWPPVYPKQPNEPPGWRPAGPRRREGPLHQQPGVRPRPSDGAAGPRLGGTGPRGPVGGGPDACPGSTAAGLETFPAVSTGRNGGPSSTLPGRRLVPAAPSAPGPHVPAPSSARCALRRCSTTSSPVVEGWQPALLVNDASELAAPLAADLGGVPHATHAFGALLPEHRLMAAAEAVAPLWRAHGLEPRPTPAPTTFPTSIYPPSLRFGTYDHVPQVQPLRPVPFDATDTDRRDRSAGDRPLVYLPSAPSSTTPSCSPRRWPRMARLDVDALVMVGPAADPAAPAGAPERSGRAVRAPDGPPPPVLRPSPPMRAPAPSWPR